MAGNIFVTLILANEIGLFFFFFLLVTNNNNNNTHREMWILVVRWCVCRVAYDVS